MRQLLSSLTVAAALAAAPFHLSAKGETIRIMISGGGLATPIEISDLEVVARFPVWAGPGTSSNEKQSLNVNWSQGVVEPPKDLPIYEVSFVTTRTNPGTYMVRYAIDPATNKGYVYLPGKTDPEYRDNVWLILRGIEGRWFQASSEWEKLANPLILKARAAR